MAKGIEYSVLAVVLSCCVGVWFAACGDDSNKRCYSGTTCRPGADCTSTVCPVDNDLAPADATVPSEVVMPTAGMTPTAAQDASADAQVRAPMRADHDGLDAGVMPPSAPLLLDAALDQPADASAAVDAATLADASVAPDAAQCVPAIEQCNQRDDDCNGVVDDVPSLDADSLNCGRCGNACAYDSRCESGNCQIVIDAGSSTTPAEPPSSQCNSASCGAEGQGCCGDTCIDLTSNFNCGGCGVICGLAGAGLACSCQLRDGVYGCYGAVGAQLSLCPR